MRTVDVLIAARELIADKKNWTRGCLRAKRDGNACYCALGAVTKAGGVLDREDAVVSTTTGFLGIENEEDKIVDVSELGRAALAELEAAGVYAAQTINAQRYLQKAIDAILPNYSVVHKKNTMIYWFNDNFGHNAVMEAFDVAIRNAKRRHITGDRKKATAQASV
jgi:hypothetical protein